MTSWSRTKYPGVQVRHYATCPAPEKRCVCAKLHPRSGGPSFRVRYRNSDGEPRWSPVMHNLDAARSWQTDNRNGLTVEARAGRTGATLEAFWAKWVAGAEAGQISTRGKERKPYSPRTLAIYKRDMELHVLPALGHRPMEALTLTDWQNFLDGLRQKMDGAEGERLSHNSLQVIFNGPRALYRWACAPARRLLPVNALHGLEMPAKDEKRRDRIAPPDEARELIAALREPYDRTDFALALYCGLRNIERWGLEWGKHVLFVDGKPQRIHVTRDITKSAAGVRTLPIIALLRPILQAEWLRQGRPSEGRVLRAPNGGRPENAYGKQAKRVAKLWEAAGLERITPHNARHTYASYLIASGLNAKAVTVLMGHSSIEITFDRYGKLFPGAEDEAGARLNDYLGGDDLGEATG